MIDVQTTARQCVVGLAAGSCLLVAQAATAGIVPDVQMSLQVSDSSGTLFDQTFNPTPTGPFGPEATNYSVDVQQTAFSVTGDLNASPTLPPMTPAFLNSTLVFNNSSSETLEFLVTMTLPMDTGMTSVQWNSSSSWTLSGPASQNPTLMTLEGSPLWAVLIDDTTVGSLYSDPSGLSGGQGDLSTSPISGQFGPVEESISIQLAFSLSSDSTAGVNGVFAVVPGPGGLALLLVGGSLIGVPRRRRS